MLGSQSDGVPRVCPISLSPAGCWSWTRGRWQRVAAPPSCWPRRACFTGWHRSQAWSEPDPSALLPHQPGEICDALEIRVTWGSSVVLWLLGLHPSLLSGVEGGKGRKVDAQSSQTREDAAAPKAGLTRAHPALSILEPKWTAALSPGCPLDSPADHRTCPYPGFTADR